MTYEPQPMTLQPYDPTTLWPYDMASSVVQVLYENKSCTDLVCNIAYFLWSLTDMMVLDCWWEVWDDFEVSTLHSLYKEVQGAIDQVQNEGGFQLSVNCLKLFSLYHNLMCYLVAGTACNQLVLL